MFGGSRRQRRYSQPSAPSNVNPNATTAAASAFMSASGQNQSKSLAASAAGAALRARPQTPTNVAEVQTKRTLRRSGSVSSMGSSRRGAASPARPPSGSLERRGSNASLTERTFRSPSPGRSQPAAAAEQQPPVPAIPPNHKKSKSTSSATVGMQAFRTASQKLGHSASTSYYTHATGDTSNVRTSDAIMTSKSPPPARAESIYSLPPRPESAASSVNFSYPSRIRAQSPSSAPQESQPPSYSYQPQRTPAPGPKSSRASVTSSIGGEQELVYDPNSRRMVPKQDLAEVSYHVRESAEKQPKRNKKIETGLPKAGSHLAKGTVARVKGTTVENKEPQQDFVREEHEAQSKRPAISTDNSSASIKAIAAEIVAPKQPVPEVNQPLHPSASAADSTFTPLPHRELGKKPSIVQEEEEEDLQPSSPPQVVLDALDGIPNRPPPHEQALTAAPEEKAEQSHQAANPPTQTSVAIPATQGPPVVAENKQVTELSKEAGAVHRSASNSPVRTTRFAANVSDQLAVRHQPPARSVSPIKSALKHRNTSPYDQSQSDQSSETSKQRDASPGYLEEPLPRKKAVRVSFDDQNTKVVGEAAGQEATDSPLIASPQTKRPWYSNIGRRKKEEVELDDDEIMKPRPALPSFGSIREKKNRDAEERPLVRPIEPAQSPAAPASPQLQTLDPVSAEEDTTSDSISLGQSSDLAVGAILAQDQISRNAANISKYREPLPPVVTSIDGNGYHSAGDSSDEDKVGSFVSGSEVDVAPALSTQTTQITQPDTDAHDGPQNGSAVTDNKDPAQPKPSGLSAGATARDIPAIAVVLPSPGATPDTAPAPAKVGYFGLPGTFPDEESSDSSTIRQAQPATSTSTSAGADSTAVETTIFEPAAEVQPAQAESLPQTTLATTPTLSEVAEKESEDDSNASIYSDAYEDLSDLDGDGFMSLDAVVESPITKVSPQSLADIPETPIKAKDVSYKQVIEPEPQVVAASVVGLPDFPQGDSKDDWEHAKSFWRSLTAEKRQQLEHEAMEDAGAEADQEEIETPIARRLSNRKKAAEEKAVVEKVVTTPTKSSRLTKTAPSTQPKTTAARAAAASHPDRVYQIQPGTKASHDEPTSEVPRMRLSMRGDPSARSGRAGAAPAAAPGVMRKSMRSGPSPEQRQAKRSTMQIERPKTADASFSATATKPKQRPLSMDAAAAFASARSAQATGLAAPVKPTVARRGSDASDSSFKRERASLGEGFGFRRTMRQSAPARRTTSPALEKSSSRFSLRSLSPAGSPFRRPSTANALSAGPASAMRRTLRSNSESDHDGKRSSAAFSSFSRGPASSKPSKPASRLADSSDEDDTPAGFRSRFNDSSDEESGRPSSASNAGTSLAKGTLRQSATAPIRSRRPPTTVMEEAEELDDSDNDDAFDSPFQTPQRAATRPGLGSRGNSGGSALGTGALNRSGAGRGSLVTAPVIPSSPGRSSFMGSILRRNKRADQAGKIQRIELAESAARRDTNLERSTGELREVRDSGSPKLQKRNAPSGRVGSWPLPEEESAIATNGNAGGSTPTRPDLAGRRTASLTLPMQLQQNEADDLARADIMSDNGIVGPQKKKKKFGALRRMFRLDD